MRVLVVTTWYPSRLNPVRGVFVQRQVEAIARRHDVAVVHLSPDDEGPPQPSGDGRRHVPVHHVPWVMSDPRSFARSLSMVRRLARHHRPNVLHSVVFSAIPHGFVAARTARASWVHSEHWSGISDPASVHPVWRALAPFAKAAYRGPDVITVVSTYLQQAVAGYGHRGRVLVVPNVVEGPSRLTPPPTGAPLRLLSVGNLVPSKHPELATRTLAELTRRGIDARLRWVGAGGLADRVHMLSLSLGIDDRMELPGRVLPDQVGAELAACQVFLLPTAHETFCVVAAEALLHGRPVVLGAVGGQRDFVTYDSGELVDEQTAQAYADAVLRVSERFSDVDPERLAGPVRTRFSSEAVCDRFDECYALALRR